MEAIRPGEVIDMHAHVYPENCLAEVIKARPEFTLENSARGLSLLCRGSHTMSAPGENDLGPRLAQRPFREGDNTMMVCPYDDKCLLLILQVDHSRVAGWLAAHWGNDDFAPPSPYQAMVLAAQEHDTGWWDWEIKPHLNEKGLPPDYIGSIKHLGQRVWLDFYRHGISRLAEQDPYAGYIVSLHADALLTRGRGLLPYMPDYTVYPEVQTFLGEQESYRASLMKELQSSPEYGGYVSDEQLGTNFKLMEIYDQMAQFVCNRYPFNATHRKNGPSNTLSDVPAPVKAGREDATLMIAIEDESRATIAPYPFDIDPLPISFQGRLIPRRRYASQAEFLREYYRAERLPINYSLHS